MNRTIIFILVLLLSSYIDGYGQQEKQNNQFEFRQTIESTYLNKTRSYTILLPDSYYNSAEAEYPVLYVLDAQNLQEHTAFLYRFLAKKGHIPEMIIVFIPHTGQRNRDYKTFYRGTEKINEGANQFLSFIENELIPQIDNDYKSTHYRLLSGHSNSGLFVIHTLFKKPTLFRARFAFSPSSHHIPKQRELLLKSLKENQGLNGYFYMNVGGNEFYKMTQSFSEIKQIFQKYAPQNLRYDFDFHDADGHQSSPLIGQHMAFKRLFAPFRLNLANYRNMTYDEIVYHFKKTSFEFGNEIIPEEKGLKSIANYYLFHEPHLPIIRKLSLLTNLYHPNSTVLRANLAFAEKWLAYGISKKTAYYKSFKPSEAFLNKLGYLKLQKKEKEAAQYLFKLAIFFYPESPNALDSLGEAFESFGDNVNALKMYKKAYNLAIKRNNPQKLYLENMERVETKLKSK